MSKNNPPLLAPEQGVASCSQSKEQGKQIRLVFVWHLLRIGIFGGNEWMVWAFLERKDTERGNGGAQVRDRTQGSVLGFHIRHANLNWYLRTVVFKNQRWVFNPWNNSLVKQMGSFSRWRLRFFPKSQFQTFPKPKTTERKILKSLNAPIIA